MQRIRGDDVVREVLETVPTPPAEDVPRPRRLVTRRGSPRLGAYAGCRRSASRLPRARPAGAGRPRRAVRAPRRCRPRGCTPAVLALQGASSGSGRSKARPCLPRRRACGRRRGAAGALPRARAGARRRAGSNPVALRLAAGEERELEVPVGARAGAATFPGRCTSAPATASAFAFEDVRDLRRPLRVYPGPSACSRSCARSRRSRASGNQVARTKGRDRVRRHPRLRPRATACGASTGARARGAAIVVNEAHPERNTDVILFLDTFSEARGTGAGRST